ncbi:alpha/beta hydrolase [Natrinema halophilum]|uniref:Alpha/beta hydrolase n=1 Tax=Natrinema halophilum TaxID=1699371 RepID=A0A7D5KBZ8_9EURY|nr:alpha/beta hydrolase [Natrinema halophilum]QLG48161.1 alpha/beta hydrolase [Natrinema halophilum]
MESDARTTSASRDSNETTSVSRRRLLQSTATAILAGTGLSVRSGPVVADSDEIMEIDFRGGSPPLSDAPQGEDEVVFTVHGYTASSISVSEAEAFQQTARNLGYTETVTAVTWDDSGNADTAEASARETGNMFAEWLARYTNANPDTTIRILGHSMGGIVQMETLDGIDGSFTIGTADSIGSYEVDNGPCESGPFYDSIQKSAAEVRNYYSTNDGIARLGSGPADCGGRSCDGTTPPNYWDVDVSGSVPDHISYKRTSSCVSRILDNY